MNCRLYLALLILLAADRLPARTWTEASTGKKIEAEFVSATATEVTIILRGGRQFKLELARLSPEDQAFVQQQLKPAPSVQVIKAEDRFEDVKQLKAEKIPVNGTAHAALAPVDEAIREFMVEKGVPAVSFAVSRNGKILHERTFGWADADMKIPLLPGVKMRLASMTKPVVSAAIQTLVTDGRLKPEDPVFDVLELAQYKEAKGCDPRWKTVTIQHLLDHKGGWDRDASGDFTTRSTEMTEMFRLKPEELRPLHVVRYGLTLPLDFDPGNKEVYCNFGYILLVRVIEKVSGQTFTDYLQATVFKTAEALSFSLSSSDARERQPGEIWYCYHPDYPQKEIPLPYRAEARDGAGGLASTAADYCRFLEAYWISGQPRKPGARFSYSFNGSLPGVTSVSAQRSDGLNYAAIANRRGLSPADWNGDLRKRIDAALDPVAAEVK
ncbi:serine hydrolase domain-containing protein [Prosthecobacter sp. SYSU 5D2]|uniref:serine hydrolase domain-containing protein n=1 Tax=Prosthecobacter sp. SYSU 5D2 TaxID=3134134 RepID=UPI0031FEF8DE